MNNETPQQIKDYVEKGITEADAKADSLLSKLITSRWTWVVLPLSAVALIALIF